MGSQLTNNMGGGNGGLFMTQRGLKKEGERVGFLVRRFFGQESFTTQKVRRQNAEVTKMSTVSKYCTSF